jgi:hypothetical protein
VRYGLCPIDKHFDDDAKDLQILAYAKLNAYDQDTHGHFFVSFQCNLYDVFLDVNLLLIQFYL